MRTNIIITFILASLLGLSSAAFAQSDVAVVVNEKNSSNNVTLGELRKIFSGEKHNWGSGTPIRLFVREPGAQERTLVLTLLGMSESEYKQYWTKQVYRGEAVSEPVVLFSNGMQKEAITTYPGAVALVRIQDVKPGMKVLKVGGYAPGDAQYPLK